jgi:hypothetical protein
MFTYTTGQQIKSRSHKKSGDAMKVVSPAIKIWSNQMKTAKIIEILIIAILVVIIFHDTIVEIMVSLLG